MLILYTTVPPSLSNSVGVIPCHTNDSSHQCFIFPIHVLKNPSLIKYKF